MLTFHHPKTPFIPVRSLTNMSGSTTLSIKYLFRSSSVDAFWKFRICLVNKSPNKDGLTLSVVEVDFGSISLLTSVLAEAVKYLVLYKSVTCFRALSIHCFGHPVALYQTSL